MEIHDTETDDEIRACLSVLRELRPDLDERDFVERIHRQQAAGYRLAYGRMAGEIVAVAGYRISENLAWGRFLYVDDLVTTAAQRSSGHGAHMLDWLRKQADAAGCSQLHLDTGLQRQDAQRFYRTNGLTATGYHFAGELA